MPVFFYMETSCIDSRNSSVLTQRENITRVCFIFSVKINYDVEQLKTISASATEKNSFNL